VDYERLFEDGKPTAATWMDFVRDALVGPWITAYKTATPWTCEVLEISLDGLLHLFDAAPAFTGTDAGDDRLVAVWGHSRGPAERRDTSRQAGFIPSPAAWSEAGRDRGHFVAHAAGGGLDLNLFPQAARLNRGTSAAGKRWRAMERYLAANPGTPLFVRPAYVGPTWVPLTIDFGLVVEGRLWWERFDNTDGPDD
jgi:hypothetical protein